MSGTTEPESWVVAFDTETTPDLDAARRLLGLAKDTPDDMARLAIKTHYAKKDEPPERAFVKAGMQKIACLSSVVAKRPLRSNNPNTPWIVNAVHSLHCQEPGGERSIIQRFGKLVERKPILVGFNSRGYDLPLIRMRAYALGVPIPAISPPRGQGEDYAYRYSHNHHDIMELMSSYGAMTRPSLVEIASLIDVPAKAGGMDGSMVDEAVQNGRLMDAVRYCEEDTVTTFLGWLRWQLVIGALTHAAAAATARSLADCILKKGDRAHHLAEHAAAAIRMAETDEANAPAPLEPAGQDAAPQDAA